MVTNLKENRSLAEFCHICTNTGDDTFVGLNISSDGARISFPIGYRLGTSDLSLRKDILLLLSVLKKFGKQIGNFVNDDKQNVGEIDLPLSSYQKIIINFLNNGYIYDNEFTYKQENLGKADWYRTIKKVKPIFQDDDVFYLDFIVKKNTTNSDNLITLIHEFCVYESFWKIGWLYTSFLPKKPRIKFNKLMFIAILKQKITETFDDNKIELLNSMIYIVNSIGNKDFKSSFSFGTFEFEYIWEKMIDHTFGVVDKSSFFPSTTWALNDGRVYSNRNLEPDTIMIYKDIVYILDSKYYKFGLTNYVGHLPETSSVHKQITYGEYVEQIGYGEVLNVFILPFEKEKNLEIGEKNYHYFGNAISNWKKNDKSYENIVGILADTKWIMNQYLSKETKEIEVLGEVILNIIKEKNLPGIL